MADEIIKRKRGRPPKVRSESRLTMDEQQLYINTKGIAKECVPFRTKGLRAYPKSVQLRDNKQGN
jgi:hypothetical protein